MSKERRLGRGLEALLGRPLEPVSYAPPAATPLASAGQAADAALPAGLSMISVYDIDSNPFQPRQDFDEAEIRSLADSIRAHGLLQPVVVRRSGPRFQLVAGERRLRAAIIAGLSQVPASVREVDERGMAEIAIVENLQRRDLNPLEKAASFQQYLQRYGCTHEELAGRLQLDRSTISNLLRLLELPTTIQSQLRRGTLTQGHARALLPLGDEREQVAFAARIEHEGLSVRQIEDLVAGHARNDDRPAPAAPATPSAAAPTAGGKRRVRVRSENVAALEQELRSALGTKVEIRQTARGRGKIVVHFKSADEFERLRDQMLSPGKRRMAG